MTVECVNDTPPWLETTVDVVNGTCCSQLGVSSKDCRSLNDKERALQKYHGVSNSYVPRDCNIRSVERLASPDTPIIAEWHSSSQWFLSSALASQYKLQ